MIEIAAPIRKRKRKKKKASKIAPEAAEYAMPLLETCSNLFRSIKRITARKTPNINIGQVLFPYFQTIFRDCV